MVESIIGIIFGLTILLISIFTQSGTVIIVFGALLLAVSIACLVMEILKKKQDKTIEAYVNSKIISLEAELEAARKEITEKNAEIIKLKQKVVKTAETKVTTKEKSKTTAKKTTTKKASK